MTPGKFNEIRHLLAKHHLARLIVKVQVFISNTENFFKGLNQSSRGNIKLINGQVDSVVKLITDIGLFRVT